MAAGGRGNLVLYGGQTSFGRLPPPPPLADTWEFDGKLWIQVQDIGPGPLASSPMAFDSTRSVVVLFGGQDTTTLSGSTWEAAPAPST